MQDVYGRPVSIGGNMQVRKSGSGHHSRDRLEIAMRLHRMWLLLVGRLNYV